MSDKLISIAVSVLRCSVTHVSVPEMMFPPLWKSHETCAGLFKFQETSRKQFSPLRRWCEARAGLFKYQERSRNLFPPLWKISETRAGFSQCLERSTKFPLLWRSVAARVCLFKTSRKQFSSHWRSFHPRVNMFKYWEDALTTIRLCEACSCMFKERRFNHH